MTSASTREPSIAAWKAFTSSAPYSRDFQARGFWLKIWIARQSRSTPRATALAGPPAGETWAPISIGPGRLAAARKRSPLARPRVACLPHAGTVPSLADRGAAHREREDGALQLAARARAGRPARAAHRGHRPRALDARERPDD